CSASCRTPFPTRRSSDLWAGALRTGALSERDVVLLFLTSPEYTAAHPNNGDFVRGLYNLLLERQGNVSAAEVAQWQGPLDSGTRSEEHTSELQSPDHLVC